MFGLFDVDFTNIYSNIKSDIVQIDVKHINVVLFKKKTHKKNNTVLSINNYFSVLNEVKLLQSVHHPNIIRLEEVIDSPECLVLVLELAEGGELFDQMIRENVLEEATAKFYFMQMTTAIAYLHSKEICHRDLKPENVLLSSSEDPNPVLKLTDLGLSKLVDKTILKTFCGTKIYMAPEMWKKAESGRAQLEVYTLKVDCWALVSIRSQESIFRVIALFLV